MEDGAGPREEARLAALRSRTAAAHGAHPSFDEAVRIAASVCAAPIAILALVERERIEVRARVGPFPQEAPRGFGFCGRTVATRTFLTIPDAALDPEAAGNGALDAPVFARFYAGAPLLTSDGHALGALAVYDHVARRLEPWQEETLQRLARLVAWGLEFEGSQRARERRRAEALASLAGGLAAELKRDGGGSPRAAELARQLLALAGHRSLRPQAIDLNALLSRLSPARSGGENAGARRAPGAAEVQSWSLALDPAIGSVLGDEERIARAITGLARRAAVVPMRPVPVGTRAVQVAPGSPACGTLAPGPWVFVSIGEGDGMAFETFPGGEDGWVLERDGAHAAGLDEEEGLMAETGGRLAMRRGGPNGPAFCLALPRVAD